MCYIPLLTLTHKCSSDILSNNCMYKKYAYLILIFIFFIFIFFKLQKSHVSYNFDEVSWFFHAVFFDELFLKHNFDKKFWLSFESFDHPQLSKYILAYIFFPKIKNIRKIAINFRYSMEDGHSILTLTKRFPKNHFILL